MRNRSDKNVSKQVARPYRFHFLLTRYAQADNAQRVTMSRLTLRFQAMRIPVNCKLAIYSASLLIAGVLMVGCGPTRFEQLLTDIHSRDAIVRRQAMQGLLDLKSNEPLILEVLVKALQDTDRDVRRLACIGLGDRGAENLAAIEKLLSDREMSVRLAAAFAALKIDADHVRARETLERVMKQGEGGVIVAVSKQGPAADWAVPIFTELLKDKRPGIRRLAAEGLSKLGPAAKASIPALKNAAQDPDDRVRDAAKSTLEILAATK